MSDTSNEELEVLREINERQKREEEEKAARIAGNRRAVKGCLIALGVAGVLGATTCVLVMKAIDSPEDEGSR